MSTEEQVTTSSELESNSTARTSSDSGNEAESAIDSSTVEATEEPGPAASDVDVTSKRNEDEQISSSTSEGATATPDNVFVQPMLPTGLSSKSSVSSSRSAPDRSTEATNAAVSSSGRKERISKEKLEKYNAILSAVNYHSPKYGASSADPRYSLEVLKNGMIVDSVSFSMDDNKGYYIIGRVPGCDIVAENPTVSRVHAVLQFVKCPEGLDGSENLDDPQQTGLYLYDLRSTHGSFINKNQVFPKKYYRVRVGHVIKFGTSQRMYIVGGPSEDEEEESDKSVSELMNERLQKDLERKRLEEEEQLKRNPKLPRDVEEEGIDWGMAEDADEETDMRINPFALDYEASELTLDNPKKTLRSWFEREGHELEYEVREKGNGQYVCRIGLPLDGPTDAPVYAESEVKGKKKEAALDAAMKACQIIDSHGLLRTSNQESRKRKEKKWQDEDYYSSDEDTFLDRTGSVEKKREKRMRMAGKIENEVETYDTLRAKYSKLEDEIAEIQLNISKSQSLKENPDEDVDIDDYMKLLKSGVHDVKKLKSRLKEATEELKKIKKLMDIAKPADLPSYLQGKARDQVIPATVVSTSSQLASNDGEKTTQTEAAASSTPSQPDGTLSNVTEEEKVNVLENKPTTAPAQRLQSKSLVGPMKPSSSSSNQQKLYGLIKLSSLPSSTLTLRPPDSRSPPNIEDKNKGDLSSGSEEEEQAELESTTASESTKTKKKRQRYRNQQKKQKVDESYDSNDPNYSVWIPPTNQSGDGKTSLNEKLGY